MHKGQERLLTFHFVDGSAKPLLSADTCELFSLLTCHVQQAELCNTLKGFADVFQGLGCLPGDYHIEVDPDVRPVQHVCCSPLLKKTPTHLGQLRKSTGEFGQSAQGTPKLTIKKLRPARFARPAQFITIGLYSLMVLLI